MLETAIGELLVHLYPYTDMTYRWIAIPPTHQSSDDKNGRRHS